MPDPDPLKGPLALRPSPSELLHPRLLVTKDGSDNPPTPERKEGTAHFLEQLMSGGEQVSHRLRTGELRRGWLRPPPPRRCPSDQGGNAESRAHSSEECHRCSSMTYLEKKSALAPAPSFTRKRN